MAAPMSMDSLGEPGRWSEVTGYSGKSITDSPTPNARQDQSNFTDFDFFDVWPMPPSGYPIN